MADINKDDILKGFSRASERAEMSIDGAESMDPELTEKLEIAFRSWPEELSPRFVEYFSEMSAISSISRRTFGFPDLDEDVIQEFLATSAHFFDSFKHR